MSDLVFDLDGTLVDSVQICSQIVNAMLYDRGAPVVTTLADMRRHISVGGAKMMAALMGECCGDSQMAIMEFRDRYAALPTPEASLFPGVREEIEHLAVSGLRLSICSSKPQNLCEKVLNDLDLADFFDVIVGSYPGRPPKPDPALYDMVLAHTGGARARSCYVGDSALDHALAVNAKVPFILAAYGYCDAGLHVSDADMAHDFSQVARLAEARLLGPVRAPAPLRATG